MSLPSSPKDWLILQCQACGAPMKVRVAAAGARLACPSCGSPVAALEPAPAHAPEIRTELPKGSTSLPWEPDFSRFRPAARKEVFAPGPAAPEAHPGADSGGFLQHPGHTGDRGPASSVRVLKRRRKVAESRTAELLDWDTPADQLPEAEIYSDTWAEVQPLPEEVIAEKTRDFVVSETEEDGNTAVRVKRVRKRRIVTFAQTFFRRFSHGMRILILTGVASISITGIAWGFSLLRKYWQSKMNPEVVAEARPGQMFLTSQDESGAVETITAFLAAAGTEAKLPHVRLPARVRPLMEKFYARTPDRAFAAGGVLDRVKISAGEAFFVILEMEVHETDPSLPLGERTHLKSFAVEEIEKDGGRTYKVDWETAVEWCEMSFEEFKQKQPRHAVPFRLKIRGHDYYNHNFADEKQWLAAELYYPYPQGRNEFIFHGYILRDSNLFSQLSPFTKTGNNASFIVNLRYPENPVSRDQVIIDSIAQPSWFYTEDRAPEEYGTASGPK